MLTNYKLQTDEKGKEENVNMIGSYATPFDAFGGHFAFGVSECLSHQGWILDSGASIHICCNAQLLSSVEKLENPHKVYLPTGSVTWISYAGRVALNPEITLDNVLLAPEFTHNLIYVSQMTADLKVKCNFSDTHCLIQKKSDDRVVGIAKAAGRLYFFQENHINYANSVHANLTAMDWHSLLGHASLTTMLHMPDIKDLCNTEMQRTILACEIYHKARQCRDPFPISCSRSDNLFDLVHVDLWGPYSGDFITRTPYVLTIVEDHSRNTWTFLMASKQQVFGIIKNFIAMIQTQFGVVIKCIRSDNGSEFVNNNMRCMLTEKGITHKRSCAYTPQQNGLVERKHRTLLQVARAMMFQVDIDDGVDNANEPGCSSPFIALNRAYLVHVSTLKEPLHYNEACKYIEWVAAMNQELDALQNNGTWIMVDLPHGKNIIGSKWVYKVKLNTDGTVERFKARLVAKGFKQEYGIDYEEVFSPVAKLVTVRVMLALTSSQNWVVHQIDINNAFLHGHLFDEIYMQPPDGYKVEKSGQVCKLVKSLYGLKQASREWNLEFCKALHSYGFVQSVNDHCLFTMGSGAEFFALLVYVDDVLIAGPSEMLIIKLKAYLDNAFTIKDLGVARYFLGMEIARGAEGMFLC